MNQWIFIFITTNELGLGRYNCFGVRSIMWDGKANIGWMKKRIMSWIWEVGSGMINIWIIQETPIKIFWRKLFVFKFMAAFETIEFTCLIDINENRWHNSRFWETYVKHSRFKKNLWLVDNLFQNEEIHHQNHKSS